MIRAAAVAAILLGAVACSSTFPTVLLVRHAEKGPGRDPDLTGEGRRRAIALVEPAREAGVVAAFHTPYKRSVQTAEPVAEILGIPLIPVDYAPGKESEHADEIVRIIQERFAGKTVLVIGHTTTIPEILKKLGVSAVRQIPESEYGTLFVVVDGGVTESRFGP